LRLAWTFNADFAHYNLVSVIWISACMILMAESSGYRGSDHGPRSGAHRRSGGVRADKQPAPRGVGTFLYGGEVH
jgi:hypothetical protein